MRPLCLIVAMAAVLVGATESARSQPMVTGRAVDSAGQEIPGASVTMTPASGGDVRKTMTSNDGTYRFENVPDGIYRVDVELPGFDVTRRNGVRVRDGAALAGDARMKVSSLCECIIAIPGLPAAAERSGRVVDTMGRPLPRARLEIVVGMSREVRYADASGSFSVLAPLDGSWSLTASDSGFRPVTLQVSAATVVPIVFTLSYTGETVSEQQIIDRGCRCPSDLFRHLDR
jgi:hypothetical protein